MLFLNYRNPLMGLHTVDMVNYRKHFEKVKLYAMSSFGNF